VKGERDCGMPANHDGMDDNFDNDTRGEFMHMSMNELVRAAGILPAQFPSLFHFEKPQVRGDIVSPDD